MSGQAERVVQILQMLGTGEAWNARALATELGVSRRTIHRDFKVIRSRGFCISHDGNTYRIDESRVLPPEEFSVDDLSALASAVSTSLLRCDPLTETRLKNALHRLIGHYSHDLQAEVTRVSAALEIEFQQPTSQSLDTFYEAIRLGSTVRFAYGGELVELAPSRLRQTSRGWHVVGRCAGDSAVRSYDLEQATQVTILPRSSSAAG